MTGSKRQRVTVADEMLLAQAMKLIPQAIQRSKTNVKKLYGDTVNLYVDFFLEMIGHLENGTGDLQVPTIILHSIGNQNIYILKVYRPQHSVGAWITNGSSTASY